MHAYFLLFRSFHNVPKYVFLRKLCPLKTFCTLCKLYSLVVSLSLVAHSLIRTTRGFVGPHPHLSLLYLVPKTLVQTQGDDADDERNARCSTVQTLTVPCLLMPNVRTKGLTLNWCFLLCKPDTKHIEYVSNCLAFHFNKLRLGVSFPICIYTYVLVGASCSLSSKRMSIGFANPIQNIFTLCKFCTVKTCKLCRFSSLVVSLSGGNREAGFGRGEHPGGKVCSIVTISRP